MKQKLDTMIDKFENHIEDERLWNEDRERREEKKEAQRILRHNENNKILREFAEDNNKLLEDNVKLREELNGLKTQQAVHHVIIENTNEMMREFKTFSSDVLLKMTNIEKAIVESNARRATWWQTFVGLGILLTACKYIYEILR